MSSRFERRRPQSASALTVRIGRIVLDSVSATHTQSISVRGLETAITTQLENRSERLATSAPITTAIAKSVADTIGDRVSATSLPIARGNRR
jgi:hypothetical protein